MTTIAKTNRYSVCACNNDYSGIEKSYHPIAKMPPIVYYIEGPGGPGSHGILHQPELYYASRAEADRMLPMLELAFRAGRMAQINLVQDVLNGIIAP